MATHRVLIIIPASEQAAANQAAYETWAVATGHETLSRAVWDCKEKLPIVPFGAGFLRSKK